MYFHIKSSKVCIKTEFISEFRIEASQILDKYLKGLVERGSSGDLTS